MAGKPKKGKRGRKSLLETNPELVDRIAWLYWNTDMPASEVAHGRGVSTGVVTKYAYLPELMRKHRPEQPYRTIQHRNLHND